MRVLVWQQLSSINAQGKWTLHGDSGHQMVMGRVREWIRLNPDLFIDVVGPELSAVHTHPSLINADVWANPHIRWMEVPTLPDAYLARFFPDGRATQKLFQENNYDVLYSREPTMMRTLLSLFLKKSRPKTVVHSSFQDIPSAPKFDGKLWLGQCESVLCPDVDLAFFQCQSALDTFFNEMMKDGINQDKISFGKAKSHVDDDGYSIFEITKPIDHSKMRFSPEDWDAKVQGKTVLFFPNRVSPSSGDYTNSQQFLNMLPRLRGQRQDFVAIANPGKHQGCTHQELDTKYGPDGFISFVSDVFNRDEYKFVASHSQIVVGLYVTDAYGGTASRECIELGCVPLWPAANEYLSLAREAQTDHLLALPDLSDLVTKADDLISMVHIAPRVLKAFNERLRQVIRARCSYEATTPAAMARMGLLAP